MTDPAARREALLQSLMTEAWKVGFDRVPISPEKAAESRALLLQFEAEVREECAKVCDAIKAEYVKAHYDAHGHVTKGPYTAGTWDGAEKCAAALRAPDAGGKP